MLLNELKKHTYVQTQYIHT